MPETEPIAELNEGFSLAFGKNPYSQTRYRFTS
jgi:hypothetical protein